MRITFQRQVERSNPMRVTRLPWILRVYRRPFDRWSAPGRQALFGAPNFLLFLAHQRLWPFRTPAFFTYRRAQRELQIAFNPKNSQFRALYLKQFAFGYEPQTTALINALVPEGGVFYDIGSNWGWFALSLAARPDFRGKVHAFEPFASSYRDLCSIVSQAGLTETVHCHQMAIADRCGTGTMQLPDHLQSGLATLGEGESPAGGTPVATLDSLAWDEPDVIKADVEGGEERVFRGGERLLRNRKPMLVFENSLSGKNLAESLRPLALLRDLGYVLHRLAWSRTQGDFSFFIGDEDDAQPQPTELLTLVEFDTRERCLLPAGLNVFACHQDRMGELERHFSRV